MPPGTSGERRQPLADDVTVEELAARPNEAAEGTAQGIVHGAVRKDG